MAFDVITPTKLARGALAVSPSVTTLYTVPASTRTMVKDIDICNTGTGATGVTLYLVESGGTPGVANTLLPNISMPLSGYVQWTGTQVLNAGDSICGMCTVAGVTVNISGGECV